jgi:two-component sensor histidine kinase
MPPPRRFRAHLLRLVLAVTLPLCLLASGLVLWLVEERRAAALREIDETALAMRVAVDRELGLTIAVLEALATSPALDEALAAGPGRPGTAAFHAQASTVAAARPEAIFAILLVPPEGGQQVMNTRVPPGAPPPSLAAVRFPPRPLGLGPEPGGPMRAAMEAGRPYVSDLLIGPVVGHTLIVAVPVLREGRAVAALAAALRPESLAQPLKALMPPGPVVAIIVDRGGVVVARAPEPQRFIGAPAPAELLAAVADPALRSARLLAPALDGTALYGAVGRGQVGPFLVGHGAPRALVDAPRLRALLVGGGGALLALAAAIGAALWLGRRLGAEVAALGQDAPRLARGEPMAGRAPPRIAEIAAARGALARSAASLAESEARFARAVAGARIATWEWEAATGRLTGSPGREALYGRPPGTIDSPEALMTALHPDDRAATIAASAKARAGADGGLYDAEFRTLWPDGTIRWLRSLARAEFGADGAARRMSGVVVDITERKLAELALVESERRLRLAQEAAGIGAWERDFATGEASWSEQVYRLHGLDPARPPPGPAAMRAMLVPSDRPTGLLFDALRRDVEAGAPDRTISVEYRIRRPSDGALRWLEVQGRLLRGPDGRPERVVGVSIDVTDRRAAQDQQALLMREVDHRAKNALAVALSVVQLAPRDVSPEEFAAGVTGRIAAMARTHSLLAERRWEGAEITALAEAELAAHEGHFDLGGPSLRLHPDAAQPVAMLLHELATNAAKHGALSRPGGRVSVQWLLTGGEPERVIRLTWCERGGPPVTGPPARAGFGSRLLVSLARRQLGGGIEFDWADPAGLTVTLRLPARHLATAPAEAPQPGLASPPAEVAKPG